MGRYGIQLLVGLISGEGARFRRAWAADSADEPGLKWRVLAEVLAVGMRRLSGAGDVCRLTGGPCTDSRSPSRAPSARERRGVTLRDGDHVDRTCGGDAVIATRGGDVGGSVIGDCRASKGVSDT